MSIRCEIASQCWIKMISQPRLTKIVFIVGIAVLIALNLYTFIVAYPETYAVNAGINTSGTILAKDFSAYYMGAWRLWNNPAHIYTFGALKDGEPVILPHPEAYKYLPSFLLVVSPFLSLNYQQALLAFDIVQFMLLPLMAYLLYKLLSEQASCSNLRSYGCRVAAAFPLPARGPFPKLLLAVGRGTSQSLHHLSASAQLLFWQPRKTIPVWNRLCIWVF